MEMSKIFQEFGRGSREMDILKHRNELPVYKFRESLLIDIKQNDTLVIFGKPGCGKSTQVPQLIHESKLEGSLKIAITQPQKVAAITLAMRVALQTNTHIGDHVGYTVPFEDVTSHTTKLKFMTDCMLLREATLDPLLKAYSVIILDEAHQRTVSTDVLFGIVKQAQKERSDSLQESDKLKVIVISSMLNVNVFCQHFGCPAVHIDRLTEPITMCNEEIEPTDYKLAALSSIFLNHKQLPISDGILVFLTGPEEIEILAHCVRKIAKRDDIDGRLKVFPFYAGLSRLQLLDVFKRLPNTVRKVVLATNIAETSITIPNIKCVIDSGMVRVRRSFGQGEALRVERCSKASCIIRARRAGREIHGTYCTLFTDISFDSRRKFSELPILTSPLSPTLLQLLASKVNLETLDLIDKPPMETITVAMNFLKELGAVTGHECLSLTAVGEKMVIFPVDPKFSKAILSAHEYGCLEEMLTIVAVLSTDAGIFLNSVHHSEEARREMKKFVSQHGDHLTFVNVFNEFVKVGQNQKKWCNEHCIRYNGMKQALEIRNQLLGLCKKSNMNLTSCGEDVKKVLKSLVCGLFLNTAWTSVKNTTYSNINTNRYRTACGLPAYIQPASVLHELSPVPRCVLFTELIRAESTYICNLSIIEPHWVNEIAPEFARRCRISNNYWADEIASDFSRRCRMFA